MTVFVDSGDVERFRGIVAAQFGLQFDDSRLGFLAEVLCKRLEAGPRDSQAYFSNLEGSLRASEEASALARELTVGETYFFRHNDQFRAFAEIALLARIRERASDRRLRLLSAGCASGEEAYSLAMILKETATDLVFDTSILAVDINPGALERAAEARFSTWALRETAPEAQKRWFRSSGRDLVLDPEIRSAVTFEQRNLTSDDIELWRPDFYDVIFCRNVIMYFSPEKMRAVIDRIARSIVPGGYLFLGHAETLRGLSQDFHLLHSHDTLLLSAPARGGGNQPAAASRNAPLRAPLVCAGRYVVHVLGQFDRASG
jgi:chemotaxis protein methyltransferase CheR